MRGFVFFDLSIFYRLTQGESLMTTKDAFSDTRRPFALFSVLVLLTLPTTVPAADLQAVEDGGAVTIQDGDRVLLVYRSTPSPYKVYVKQWYTPAGLQVLRDSPHDHVHHHSLMYAIGAEDVDFWGEHARYNPGKQVPRGDDSVTVVETDEQSHATIRQTIDWIDKDGNRLLLEMIRLGFVSRRFPDYVPQTTSSISISLPERN